MGNFISSNTYDPSHVDTSAKWRPTASSFPYAESDEEVSDEEELSSSEEKEINLSKDSLDKKWKQQSSGDFLRGDPQSFGRNFHGIAFENFSHRSGISPLAGMYKNMDGPPIGTGGSSQAFKTTGNHKSIETYKGFTKGNVKSKKRKSQKKFRLKDYFENLEEADHELLENFFLSNKALLYFNV